MSSSYAQFLERKLHLGGEHGFAPVWMPDAAFDFQEHLMDWSIRRGRAALFADTGLGKSLMALTWGENVVRHTNGRVLLMTPLAVGPQMVGEGEKFGVEVVRSRDGKFPAGSRIIVTNYEQLHHFDPRYFVGAICDESSCIKNFSAKRTSYITDFMRKLPYRHLCTATAAPNDYIELGTSSEALGELGYMDMLSRFFKTADGSGAARGGTGGMARRFAKQGDPFGGKFRFRGHAEDDFWRWVCSWARAIRRPSDLGFDDGPFILPPLTYRQHVVTSRTKCPGLLFDIPAQTLPEQREERRRTLPERCEMAASLVNDTGEPAVVWCHLNPEGDLLERLIPDAEQVSGKDSDERKEELLTAFSAGEIRVLVTKQKIAGWGLNWQHCAHQVTFPSHSFEALYQGTRRSWRYGQKRPVFIDMVTTEGESKVLANLERKAKAADEMFDRLVRHMNDELRIGRKPVATTPEEVPAWL